MVATWVDDRVTISLAGAIVSFVLVWWSFRLKMVAKMQYGGEYFLWQREVGNFLDSPGVWRAISSR